MEQFLASWYTLFQWQNVMLMLIGTLIGVVVGILPGIGVGQPKVILIIYSA